MELCQESAEEPEARRATGPLPHEVRKEFKRAIDILQDSVTRVPEKRDEIQRHAAKEGIPGELVELRLEDPGIVEAVIRHEMERNSENARKFIRAATLERLARVPDPDRK